MNRYDWLLWAFKLMFSSDVIAEVKKLVARYDESQSRTGVDKRDFVEESVKPMIGETSVFLLRGLIEVVLGQIRAK